VTGPGDAGADRPGDADAPLDQVDLAILAGVRDMYGSTDPPPPDLDNRVLFALALSGLEDEVARLRDEALVGSGPRGALRTRTLTFESADLEIMIAVTEVGGGQVRVDGWLVPPGPRRVELRIAGAQPGAVAATRTARADAAGRFVIGGIRRGLAQVRVLPAASGASGVVTASFAL
jgi:hypothetical protein